MSDWQPIETAPKDGTDILAYRADCGVLLVRYAAPAEFMTDGELEGLPADAADQPGWMCADFVAGWRLDGDLTPTLWTPLPDAPEAK